MFTEQEKEIIKSICYNEKGNANTRAFKEEKWDDKNLFTKLNNLPLTSFRKKVTYALSGDIIKHSQYFITNNISELLEIIPKLSPGAHKIFYKNNKPTIDKILFHNSIDISELDYTNKCWFIFHNLKEIPQCGHCSKNIKMKKYILTFCDSNCQNKHLNRNREHKKSHLSNDEIKHIVKDIRADHRNPNHNDKIANIFVNIKEWGNSYSLKLDNKILIYHFLHNITSVPKCDFCNNKLLFISGEKGYSNTCGDKTCIRLSQNITVKQKRIDMLSDEQKAFLDLYEIDLYKQSNIVKMILENKFKTCKICDTPLPSDRQTYCSKSCMYIDEELSKIKSDIRMKNILEKHGFIPFGVTKEELELGYINVSQLDSTKTKIATTNLDTFRHINSFHSPKAREGFNNIEWKEVVENMKTTLLDKYGVTNIMKLPLYKNKISSTLREKYQKLHDSNFSSNLYIFKSEKYNVIKIGVSDNPKNRLKYILKYVEDAEVVKTIFIENVYGNELKLHRKYENESNMFEQGSGRTEWFNDIILDDVINDFNNLEKASNGNN